MITRQPVTTTTLAERRSADAQADPYVGDRYFTDGVNLYRLIRWLSRPGEQPLAELEDCRLMHCALLDREALVALALRAVAVTG